MVITGSEISLRSARGLAQTRSFGTLVHAFIILCLAWSCATVHAYVLQGSDPVGASSRLSSISTRAVVQIDNDVLIGGFVIGGTGVKQLLLRALGPTLTQFGVTGALLDPTLELRDSSGGLVVSNDNWGTAANAQSIPANLRPPNAHESAILATLIPGSYTAIVRGVNNTTGVALVEAYDFDTTGTSRLTSISTRGLVQTNSNVMIAGVIVQTNSEKVIVRALGPTLASFGITNPLADPTVELHDANGNLLASNDNWKTTQQTEITASGYAPPNDLESAIVSTLAPGNYTAIVRGVNGTTGVALVEVYALQAQEVWIAVRTDGLPGTGTQTDPYDGSTAAKLDTILRLIPAYTRIHLGPGTFLTTGSFSYNEARGYYVKAGWKINGAGKELTTVKATFYPTTAGTNGHCVFEGDCNVDGNGTEITDLTVDCNWQNLGAATNTRTAAINLFGNNCRISRVKAINAYGNWASLAECFCLEINPVRTMPATGAVIEGCEVSNFQGDYGYAICLPNYGPTVGKITGTIRNNRVTGWIGTAAYSTPGGFNSVFEGNYASGCRCSLYFDTDTIENVEINNNSFVDCHGFGILFMPTLGTASMKNVTIENNTIEIADYDNGPNVALAIGPASAGIATNITVRSNTILRKTTGTGYTNQAAMTISYCDGLLIENNVVDPFLYSSLFAGTQYANENVTVRGNLTSTGGIALGLEDTVIPGGD